MTEQTSIPTPLTTRFAFGKKKGQSVQWVRLTDKAYLEWVMTTDIPQRDPELGAMIRQALDTPIPYAETVETEVWDDAPEGDFSATVRGGGSFHDGVISVRHFTVENDEPVEHDLSSLTYDERSRSGASGHYGWYDGDFKPGAYIVRQSGGSIANHETTQTIAYFNGETWYKTRTLTEALSLARGAAIVTK